MDVLHRGQAHSCVPPSFITSCLKLGHRPVCCDASSLCKLFSLGAHMRCIFLGLDGMRGRHITVANGLQRAAKAGGCNEADGHYPIHMVGHPEEEEIQDLEAVR
jgi:hypothetical protein